MVIVFREKLYAFAKKHADSRKALVVWQREVEKANWKSGLDVIATFPHAKIIRQNRARFPIRHNVYRLITYINYEDRLVFVRFIGTHKEYDRIDPETI